MAKHRTWTAGVQSGLDETRFAWDTTRSVIIRLDQRIDESELVTVTFAVVNLSHSGDQQNKAAELALAIGGGIIGALGVTLGVAGDIDEELALKVGGAILGMAGSVFATIGGVLGIDDPNPNCDGEVFTRVLTLLPGELRPESMGPSTETTKSPVECGADPHSTVRYAIREAVANVFPAGSPVSALSTAPRETSLNVMGPPNAVDAAGNAGSQVWSNFFPGPDGGWSNWFPF